MRVQLQVVCFLLVVCSAHCFTNILRRIRGLGKDNQIASRAEKGEERGKEEPGSVEKVKVPERLFSKEVAKARKSYCHQARLEFGNLCGLRSATERAKLASHVTNCHLEVSGRPVFVWDPEKKLADASDQYVYLVMQFIPLMTDVCEKAGYSPMLSQLVADAKSSEDIGNKIDELQTATERLFEANRQSSEFATEYMNMSAEASRKLKHMLNISMAIKEANDVINNQWHAIHQEANDIKAELQAFTRNSVTLFDSMLGRFDGFQTQMSSISTVVDQIQSDSHATSMFLKEPLEAISNTSDFINSRQESSHKYFTMFPLGSLRKVGFIVNIILGPIKLSERIRHLESNRFIGPYAKDIFSSLQMLLVLLSIYIAYTILTMFTKVVEATLQFATVFRPLRPIVAKISHFFGIGNESTPMDQEQRIKAHLSEHISATISKNLAGSEFAEKLSKLVRNNDVDARISLLFTRISEVDMRLSQISQDVRLLHQPLQSLDHFQIRESGTGVFSRSTIAMENEGMDNRWKTTSSVTKVERDGTICDSSDNACDSPSRRITNDRSKSTYTGESEFSEQQFCDSTNRSQEGDAKDNVSHKENNSIIAKPERPRRRSSRRKLR